MVLGEAREAAGNGDYRLAAQLQYWAVETTGTEQYDLACYHARLGRVNAAFYWLQLAAVEDGVDAAWAEQDPDLEPLRGDARWGKVRDYFAAVPITGPRTANRSPISSSRWATTAANRSRRWCG